MRVSRGTMSLWECRSIFIVSALLGEKALMFNNNNITELRVGADIPTRISYVDFFYMSTKCGYLGMCVVGCRSGPSSEFACNLICMHDMVLSGAYGSNESNTELVPTADVKSALRLKARQRRRPLLMM